MSIAISAAQTTKQALVSFVHSATQLMTRIGKAVANIFTAPFKFVTSFFYPVKREKIPSVVASATGVKTAAASTSITTGASVTNGSFVMVDSTVPIAAPSEGNDPLTQHKNAFTAQAVRFAGDALETTIQAGKELLTDLSKKQPTDDNDDISKSDSEDTLKASDSTVSEDTLQSDENTESPTPTSAERAALLALQVLEAGNEKLEQHAHPTLTAIVRTTATFAAATASVTYNTAVSTCSAAQPYAAAAGRSIISSARSAFTAVLAKVPPLTSKSQDVEIETAL